MQETTSAAEPDQGLIDSSDELGAKKPKMHPNSLANLRPPFLPGVSGNPSGLTKDGRSPKGRRLEACLQEELEKSGGMQSLAKRWLALAKKGNATALGEILKRLYPADEGNTGKTILEGLSLELTSSDGTRASLKAMRGSGDLPAAGDGDDAVEQEGEGPGGIDHQVTPGPGDTGTR